MIRDDGESGDSGAHCSLPAATHAMRRVEVNAAYRLSAAGYLAEVDRMNLEVREYLSLHPSELPATVGGIVDCGAAYGSGTSAYTSISMTVTEWAGNT